MLLIFNHKFPLLLVFSGQIRKWNKLDYNLNPVLSVEHFQIEKYVSGFLNFIHVDKMIKEKKWKKFSQLCFFLT